MANERQNSTATASVERMKTLKSIEAAAVPAWEKSGVLRTNSIDTAETSLLEDQPTRRVSALVKRMPARRRAKR